jgi:hypothetical protein
MRDRELGDNMLPQDKPLFAPDVFQKNCPLNTVRFQGIVQPSLLQIGRPRWILSIECPWLEIAPQHQFDAMCNTERPSACL